VFHSQLKTYLVSLFQVFSSLAVAVLADKFPNLGGIAPISPFMTDPVETRPEGPRARGGVLDGVVIPCGIIIRPNCQLNNK